ncbi:preprotein translocase subunit SecE [Gammaproteobacteria bacterium]|jgi:preprotein translocase subunit SecE|nr:preprotein translocase subunit SecE [Gammaproteobacteria bacterium]
MAEKIESSGTKLDGVKWLVVVAITAAAIYANSYFATQLLLVRVSGLLVAAAVAGWIAVQTAKGRSFLELCLEARTEIRKVVWPTRQETTQTTLVVLVVIFIVALILWLLDWALNSAVSTIIG